MQANYEYNEGAYPIAAMFNGQTTADGLLCDIVDVRTLEVLYPANSQASALVPALAEMNSEFHAGKGTTAEIVQRFYNTVLAVPAESPAEEPSKAAHPVLASLPGIGEQA